MLVAHGWPNPSKCDSLGQAPIHRAAINDSVDVVQLLLDHNVDIEARSLDFSRTPLHWAAWHGHTGGVSLFITRRTLVESYDKQKWTALHLAASQGHQEIVDRLLRKHVEIDAKDRYGATALYRAAEGGHEAAAHLLLIEGARPDIPNDYDQTPLHRAADLGRLATERLLLNHADHGHNEIADVLADFAEAARMRTFQQVLMLQSGSTTLVTRKNDSHVTPKDPACVEDLALLENYPFACPRHSPKPEVFISIGASPNSSIGQTIIEINGVDPEMGYDYLNVMIAAKFFAVVTGRVHNLNVNVNKAEYDSAQIVSPIYPGTAL
ncbi:MAG: hypothetical protein LQ337_007463 [Flavoplaca oasis]|nr:MAG: hypothetical protein LQ337_007463 [Flavoplaca oasis]